MALTQFKLHKPSPISPSPTASKAHWASPDRHRPSRASSGGTSAGTNHFEEATCSRTLIILIGVSISERLVKEHVSDCLCRILLEF